MAIPSGSPVPDRHEVIVISKLKHTNTFVREMFGNTPKKAPSPIAVNFFYDYGGNISYSAVFIVPMHKISLSAHSFSRSNLQE